MKQIITTDILVSGGGVPGLTLALLLGKAGLDVTVIDPVPVPDKPHPQESRTTALMQGSVNILKATGGWARCADQGCLMTGLSIVDESGKRLDFESREIGQKFFSINMFNTPLRIALATEARAVSSITLQVAGLKTYETDDFGVTATLDNGKTYRAKLLVGADGRNSPVRKGAGIDLWEKDYGQKAITCLIDHSRPHDNISTEIHKPGGPFAIVPLSGNQSAIVWVETSDNSDSLMALDKSSFTRALQDQSRDIVGTITLATNPVQWPLKALKAKALCARRIALVAEAAHVIHPLGAQGLNLSLRDVAALAETVIDGARLGQDIGSRNLLAAYESKRRYDIASRVKGTDLLTKIVSTQSGLLRDMRGKGLNLVGAAYPLKKLLMKEGMAPQAGQGRLAQGQPL